MNRPFSRIPYNLRRFGFSPDKITARFRNHAPVVFANSIPKSGTHLLESLLTAHPWFYRQLRPTLHMGNIGKEKNGLEGVLSGSLPGAVIIAHLWHRSEWEQLLSEAKVPSLLMVRDPRDVAISLAHYITKNNKHAEHQIFQRQPDAQARLLLAIQGDASRRIPSLKERIEPFLAWLDGNSLLVPFENLVGSGGGGSDALQLETVCKIFQHIGCPLEERQAMQLAEQTFSSKSPTFRKGRIRQWENVFTNEISETFDRNCADLPEKLGYS